MESKVRRRRRQERDIDAYLAGCARMLRAAGRRVGQGTPEDLKALEQLHAQVEHALGVAAIGLREGGHTWQEIGDAMGFSKQAAIKRWNPQRNVDDIRFAPDVAPLDERLPVRL